MPYTNITKPSSTTYTTLSKSVDFPQYGFVVYGTAKYGILDVYTPVKHPKIIDSYDKNYQNTYSSFNPLFRGYSQSFSVSSSATLDKCSFYLKKIGSPAGNAVAKIYAITGTYGTNALPTGTALATSDNFDVSAVASDFNLYSFNFSGVNKIKLTPNYYCLTLEYAGGTATNTINVGSDIVSLIHGGNAGINSLGSWTTITSPQTDFIFYIYKTDSYTNIAKPS